MKRSALFAAVCLPALVAAAGTSAKTLVYCSEGSPENFYPAINTTGTSFDATSQIYSRLVDFARGARAFSAVRTSHALCLEVPPGDAL